MNVCSYFVGDISFVHILFIYLQGDMNKTIIGYKRQSLRTKLSSLAERILHNVMLDPVDTRSKLKVHKTEGAVEKYSKKLMLCTSYQQP